MRKIILLIQRIECPISLALFNFFIFNLFNIYIKNKEYNFRIYEIAIANHHKNDC